MNKNQEQLESELAHLKEQVETFPEKALFIAEQCQIQAQKMLFSPGEIQALLLRSQCCWFLKEFRQGYKLARDAYRLLMTIDTDEWLPEILYLQGQHHWGQKKFYSAQQAWIQSLEQAALLNNHHILVDSLVGIANIWRETERLPLATSTHQLAADIANQMRLPGKELEAQLLLAWDYYLDNRYVDMLSILDSARDLLKHQSNDIALAKIWDFRALALLGLERYEDAEAATNKVHQLAVSHDMTWMKAHSYVRQARLALLKKETEQAAMYLDKAQIAATNSEDKEIISQIFFQKSQVAEQQGKFDVALEAFVEYKKHSLIQLKEHTQKISFDNAQDSRAQLEKRSRKIINRIRGQFEYDSNNPLTHLVSETFWWEQLVLFKSELNHSPYAIVLLYHSNNAYLDTCTEIIHSLATEHDYISRLSSDYLALLVAENSGESERIYHAINTMLSVYPWERKSLDSTDKVTVSLHDILTFPFTLEQLEQNRPMALQSTGQK